MPKSRLSTARVPLQRLAALAVGTLALVFLATGRPAAAGDTDLAETFTGLIEQAAAVPQDPPSAILLVVAPRLGLDWTGAAPGPGP